MANARSDGRLAQNVTPARSNSGEYTPSGQLRSLQVQVLAQEQQIRRSEEANEVLRAQMEAIVASLKGANISVPQIPTTSKASALPGSAAASAKRMDSGVRAATEHMSTPSRSSRGSLASSAQPSAGTPSGSASRSAPGSSRSSGKKSEHGSGQSQALVRLSPQDTPSRQAALATVLATHHSRLETWSRKNTSLHISLDSEDSGIQLVGEWAARLCGNLYNARKTLESGDMHYLVTAVCNEVLHERIFKCDAELFGSFNNPIAADYEAKIKAWGQWWRPNGMKFVQRQDKMLELASMANRLQSLPGFWDWERWNASQVAKEVFDVVRCMMPPEAVDAAWQELVRMCDQALRMAIRMRTATNDFDSVPFKYGENVKLDQVVIRDENLRNITTHIDPDLYVVRLAISPQVTRKHYHMPQQGRTGYQQVETLHRADVFIMLKSEQGRRR